MLSFDLFVFQWYREALTIATEHFGEKDDLRGVIYYNTGNHYTQRGELEEAYENYKQSYLICEEVFMFVFWKYLIISGCNNETRL